MSKFIVMTAKEKMPNSCWGNYGKVAVVETDGVSFPKQIHPRHKAVVAIVRQWRRLNVGRTEKCAFRVALAEAKAVCAKLNCA